MECKASHLHPARGTHTHSYIYDHESGFRFGMTKPNGIELYFVVLHKTCHNCYQVFAQLNKCIVFAYKTSFSNRTNGTLVIQFKISQVFKFPTLIIVHLIHVISEVTKPLQTYFRPLKKLGTHFRSSLDLSLCVRVCIVKLYENI